MTDSKIRHIPMKPSREQILKRLQFIKENNGQIFVMTDSDWILLKEGKIFTDVAGYLRIK